MILECTHVCKALPGGAAGLRDISICFETPSFILISGPNGSGKSLFLRHLFGLEKPDTGSIRIDGLEPTANPEKLRKRMALVFQEPEHQILGVRVFEDAAFTPRALGHKPHEYEDAVRAALDMTGLSGLEERLCATLSGGEKRRLAIASALVTQPELIALDEPFNGLDWHGASDLLRILIKLQKNGVGIIVVTHDLEKCLAHASRLVVIRDGTLAADGSPEELAGSLSELGLRGCSTPVGAMSWLKAD